VSVVTSIESVAIVGGGFMGTGIAEAVAVAGLPVVVREVDTGTLAAAQERIERSLARAVKGGKLDAGEAEAARGRMSLTTELDAVAAADLVVEAVPENEELKLQVIQAIGALARDDSVIASNTSSIPIAQLAQAVTNPERVVGLHFFSPVPVMSLVEIVVALDTSPDTVATARSFAERIG